MPQATTCNPADRGEAFNKTEMALEGGAVLVTILWGWDGTSTIETGCDGPVESIRVRNVSTVTYYANLPSKKRGNRNIAIAPGTDTVLSGNGNLRNLGLELYSDTAGVTLHQEPLALRK